MARLPQLLISHQRRVPLRVVSKTAKPHSLLQQRVVHPSQAWGFTQLTEYGRYVISSGYLRELGVPVGVEPNWRAALIVERLPK